MLELGYALSSAKVTDAKFGSCGEAEITLRNDECDLEICFWYDAEQEVSLAYCDRKYVTVDGEYVNNGSLFRDIDWGNMFGGKLADIYDEESSKYEKPYFDFFLCEYETEEEEVYA